MQSKEIGNYGTKSVRVCIVKNPLLHMQRIFLFSKCRLDTPAVQAFFLFLERGTV